MWKGVREKKVSETLTTYEIYINSATFSVAFFKFIFITVDNVLITGFKY